MKKLLIVFLDQDGNELDGSSSYSLHIPFHLNSVNLWCMTVCDDEARGIVQEQLPQPDLSLCKDKVKNNDGSVDLFFGPEAPTGNEQNWVQTIAGKPWFVCMSFAGQGNLTLSRVGQSIMEL
jgi:hypothetical protein